jgi:Ca2+-binding EF-hand superfamily protein
MLFSKKRLLCSLLASLTLAGSMFAQPPEGGRPGGGERRPGEGGPPGGFMRVNPMMVALDTNKDGTLSKEEIENAAVALRTLDKNNDGKLTEDELRPAGGPGEGFGGRPGEGFGRRSGPGGPGGPGGEGNPEEIVARFMQFDANKDNKLGKDELSERMQGLLTRADADKDGFATKEELMAMAQREAASGGTGRGGPGGDRGRPGGEGGRPPGEQGERRPQRPE